MYAELSSSKAKVKDIAKVRDVLESYDMQCVQFLLYEDGVLDVVLVTDPETDDGEAWPQALRQDHRPDRDEFPDEESWRDAIYLAWDEKGDEGFVDLLRELGPYLLTPLMILAASRAGHGARAQVWRIEPRAKGGGNAHGGGRLIPAAGPVEHRAGREKAAR